MTVKPFEVIKFLNGERTKELKLADAELAALEGWTPPLSVRAYRRKRARYHKRRANFYQSAIQHLTKKDV